MLIGIQLSAVGSVSWTAPSDGVITGFGAFRSSAGIAVLSSDPNISAVTVGAPSSSGIDKSILALAAAGNLIGAFSVPVSAGEGLFVAVTGSMTAIIRFVPND